LRAAAATPKAIICSGKPDSLISINLIGPAMTTRRFPPPWSVERALLCAMRSLHTKVKTTTTILWLAFYCQ
jgi:hypothetical protein